MDSTTIAVAVVVIAVLVVAGVLLFRSRSEDQVDRTDVLPARPRSKLASSLETIWSRGVDATTWADLEDALIAADVGVAASTKAVEGVKAARPQDSEAARAELERQLRLAFDGGSRELALDGTPSVVLVVGVNGTGKTTTIAKLANRFVSESLTVILGAADTFRAAAGAQLTEWGNRLGVDVVSGQEGGDPASVAFDAVASGQAKGADVVIIDTAGRLHGKANLMDELGKIHRVAAGDRGRVDEVLLVLDATGGQNGIAQVSEFADAVPVTGVVLTKLDGTARGGIVITVETELGVPVKFVGTGEGIDDLTQFDPDRFVTELLEEA